MGKVIKIFLRKGFTPVDKSVFKLDTYVDFDCYIERFNGYAIIIHAGTYLDEKMYEKLSTSRLNIYVQNEDYEDYKNYTLTNKNTIKNDEIENNSNQIVTNIDKLQETLENEKNLTQKLKIIYFTGKNLIDTWYKSDGHKALPLDDIEILVENLIEIIDNNRVTLSHINDFIENHYILSSHLLNVTLFTSLISKQLDYDIDDQKKLALSAIYHDIGTREIDEELVNKPDFLSEKEFETIKEHAFKSAKILMKNGLKDRYILNGVKHHHERLDGSGYPNGLSKKAISEFGQILAVCDVFDALITVKPYRGAYSTYNALKLMSEEYKKKLNMKYVNIFIKLLK